jgi:hypothetical protein
MCQRILIFSTVRKTQVTLGNQDRTRQASDIDTVFRLMASENPEAALELLDRAIHLEPANNESMVNMWQTLREIVVLDLLVRETLVRIEARRSGAVIKAVDRHVGRIVQSLRRGRADVRSRFRGQSR